MAVLRQIAEAFASKGDWLNSLEFGRKLADVEPYDESGIRVKLRCLGALGRLGEAQSEYALFTKRLSADLGLRASVPLRRMADTVISGRFHEAGTGPVGSQAELIWQILSVMVEEAPEQVLPLLGSPKLNWFIALSGPELKSLLEKVFRQTSGWDPNRRGIAKRLLQIYLQNLESDRTIELADELLSNGDPLDQIASLNYLGMAHNDMGKCSARLHLLI